MAVGPLERVRPVPPRSRVQCRDPDTPTATLNFDGGGQGGAAWSCAVPPFRASNVAETAHWLQATGRDGVIAAKQLFGMNLAYEIWPLGSTRNEDGTCTVPPKLVEKVLEQVLPQQEEE